MKKLFYYLSVSLLFCGSFFISQTATTKAATYLYQQQSGNLGFWTNSTDGGFIPPLGAAVATSATTTLYATFASISNAVSICSNVQILGFYDTTYNQSAPHLQSAFQGTNFVLINSSTQLVATSSQTIYFYSFQYTGSIQSGDFYTAVPYNCATTFPSFLSSQNGFVTTGAGHILNGTSWGAVCDLSSYSSSTGCAPATPPSGVSFGFPTDGITTPDFSNWTLIPTGLPPDGTFSVVYGSSSSSLNLTDSLGVTGYPADNSPVVFKKNNLLWIPSDPIPSVWYAQAIYSAATSSFFTSIESFNVDPTTSTPSTTYSVFSSPFIGGSSNVSTTYPTIGSSTQCVFNASNASSSALVTFFDPLDLRNTFAVAICNSFTFLFIPTTQQQSDMTNGFLGIASSVSSKPPIGYFTIASNDLAGLSSSTATSSLITSSTRSTFASIFSPLDIGLGSVIGLLALLWAFHRIRNFNFHA